MGLSTHWVFSEYSRAREQYQQFLTIQDRLRDSLDAANKRIRELEKEKDELKAKLNTLHTKQFKSNKKPKCSLAGQPYKFCQQGPEVENRHLVFHLYFDDLLQAV